MTRVVIDVSDELLPEMGVFLKHVRVVGSDRNEHEHTVRLIVESEHIPNEYCGMLCRAIVRVATCGLARTTTLSFEPIW
jgi:hypothetical protein